MAEPHMTMAEIGAKYPTEWVLIANPTQRRWTWFASRAEQIKWGNLTGGTVVFHSPDRAEFRKVVGDWDDPVVEHTASLYMGTFPLDEIELAESESGAA